MPFKIDWASVEALPPDKKEQALQLLEELELAYEANPLLRFEPHTKQKPFLGSHDRLKAFLGGNQSGKTTAGVLDDLIQAVDEEIVPDPLKSYKQYLPPFRWRIVTPDLGHSLDVVLDKIREWCPPSQLIGSSFEKAYDKNRRVLLFKNHSKCDFLSNEMDRDKFGGVTLDRIHYDEEPRQDIRNEGLPRLLKRNGDELFTMTPLLGMSWMYDAVWERREQEDVTVIQVDMDDNPHLNLQAKLRTLAVYSDEEKQARKEGKFVSFSGLVYPEFARLRHVTPTHDPPEDAEIYVGIDPGIRHETGVVWAYLDAEDTLVIFDEIAEAGRTVKQIAEAIQLQNGHYGISPKWYVIDPSARNKNQVTGRSTQMEFADHGIYTFAGQNPLMAGINRIKERLQNDKLKVTANCDTFIRQMTRYRWSKPGRVEDDPKEKPVSKDDDVIDAARYLVMARPRVPEALPEPEPKTWMERAIRQDMKPKVPTGPAGPGIYS